jgi:anion-transporting  ArsA/GET3 family ATPase
LGNWFTDCFDYWVESICLIMKTNEVKKLSKDINDNLLELIDLKIDNDMREVINKIEVLQNKSENEFKRIEDNFNTKFNMIIWAIGLLIALIIGLKVFA